MGNIVLKTFSRLLLAFILSAFIPAAASAQEYESTPVTISKDKVRVDGKICYSHVVLERQTLFSISKAYNVSIDEIYRYNPSVKEEGLKKNSILEWESTSWTNRLRESHNCPCKAASSSETRC